MLNSTNISDLADGSNMTETVPLDCPKFDDAAMKVVEGFSFW
jgi:hypothetical protein